MSGPDVGPGASEQDARLVEEDAEELYEDAPCGYLSTALDGTILRANRTFLELGGYEAGELVGRRRFYDLLPPGAKIYYETHYAPLLQMQGSVRELALELVRADGRRLPVLVNASLKQDASGRPLLVRVTVFDASERRRYERELLHARSEAESRAAAATALERVTEGVVLVDDDGRIRLLNPAAERIFGVAAGDVHGLPLTSLTSSWEAVASRIPVVPGDGEAVHSVVVPLVVASETRWVAAAGRSAPEGVVYTLRDVTEERRLDELRDDIVAIVSHELRTPLAGVYGAAQTLAGLGDRLDPEQHRQLVAVIGEQSGRLTRIVEQILLTNRLDSGEVAQERGSFDLGAAVERIVAATPSWRSPGRVALEAETGVEVEGDPALFEQVLASLLDNAIRYGPPEGETKVTVERVRASGRVVVADEGPGIPEGERERVFERFYRLDPQQASGSAGVGLGLYIARELVRRMHGRLELLPTARGAAFSVELPLRRDAAA